MLKDPKIIQGARKWIDATLSSQEPDGYFGPRANKTGLDGHPDLWPHMVMLNVLQSFYEFTGDERVIPFMTRYLKWLNAQPPETFGRGYWPKIRFGDTLESAHWLYNRTGEAWLLDLASKIHENMARWDTGVIDWHNVNLSQGFREPGVYYEQARDQKFLDAAERNYQTVMGMYGQFPGGGFAGDENCRPGYVDPAPGFRDLRHRRVHAQLRDARQDLRQPALGRPLRGNRLQLPAGGADARPQGPHYLTCANQVQLDKDNKSPGIQNGGTMFSYSPYEVYRCCQHNVSHGWPYYAEELWLATPDRGLCASLYAASEVTAKVGDAAQRHYLRRDRLSFQRHRRVQARRRPSPSIPALPPHPALVRRRLRGHQRRNRPLDSKPLAYAVLDRTWKDGDRVSLRLPMKVSVRKWAKNNDSVSVDYGPLTFSLKIGERYSRYGGTPAWPELEVFPTTPWNYGLVLDDQDPAKSFEVVTKPGPVPLNPFTTETAPDRTPRPGQKDPRLETG